MKPPLMLPVKSGKAKCLWCYTLCERGVPPPNPPEIRCWSRLSISSLRLLTHAVVGRRRLYVVHALSIVAHPWPKAGRGKRKERHVESISGLGDNSSYVLLFMLKHKGRPHLHCPCSRFLLFSYRSHQDSLSLIPSLRATVTLLSIRSLPTNISKSIPISFISITFLRRHPSNQST